jgi:succinyl-CoA synthetase beta subunit
VFAVDAKVSLDDSAGFRRRPHPQATADGLEEHARKAGFAYVRLDGDIGIMGNGAGLVMTLLDMLADAGGNAADFLDIGGGASQQRIEAALDILLDDARIAVVLLVVYGGITRCDEVARGLLAVLESRESTPPLVVQLSGTNAAEAAGLLAERVGPEVVIADSLRDAVNLALEITARRASRSATGRLPARASDPGPQVAL